MLLFPILDYCAVVLCDFSAEQELKLQRVMNAGIKYVHGIRKSVHVTLYRKSLKWLTIKGRRNWFAVVLAYRMFGSGTPSYLYTGFIPNVSCRPVRGERKPLMVPSSRSEFYQRSFCVTTTHLWNALPSVARGCATIHSFKKLTFSLYLSLEAGLSLQAQL